MQQVKNLLPTEASIEDQRKNISEEMQTRLYDRVRLFNDRIGDLEGYDCPICKNRGRMMIREDDGYEIVRDCECMQFRMDKRLVERSGLALRLENYQLDKFETSEQWQKRMKEAAEQFIEDYKGKWFVTLGCSGAGKTHLNCSIVSELMRKGNPAKYISWRDLTIKLKPLMNTDEYIREIYEYKNSKVLYIDDLFKNGHFRTPSTADLDIAMEILNFRYNNREKYTTLISSEHLIDSIMAFDEALGSRIFEMCGDKYLLQIDKDSSKNYRLKNY